MPRGVAVDAHPAGQSTRTGTTPRGSAAGLWPGVLARAGSQRPVRFPRVGQVVPPLPAKPDQGRWLRVPARSLPEIAEHLTARADGTVPALEPGDPSGSALTRVVEARCVAPRRDGLDQGLDVGDVQTH